MMLAEITWAAGLFEGEGSVFVARDGRRLRLVASLETTDLDVLERFLSVIETGVIHGPYMHAKATKPSWKWKATGDDAELVANLLLPFLGERRTAATRAAIEAFRSQPPAIVGRPRLARVCEGQMVL